MFTTFTAKTLVYTIFLVSLANCAVYNAKCSTNSECHSIYTEHYICETGHCIREPFTWNTWREFVGAFVIVVISMFANAGGLGAGAVIIPVYIFIYGFATTDSIPLSKITIFAGAIASVMFMVNQRREDNPNKF